MKDIIIFFVIIFVFLICVIGSCAEFMYKYARTDVDCWFANDPIVCQKIKDGTK